MALILRDGEGRELKVNAWNWGVVHRLVEQAGLFPEPIWAPKRDNGGGALDPSEVVALAGFLEREVLPRMRPGERMFLDGTVTDVPDTATLYRGQEAHLNYSLHQVVLVKVIEFLRGSTGPVHFH